MILEAYEKALAEFPRKDHRHRIEHGPGNWMLTPKRLEQLKRLGLIDCPNLGLLLYYLGDTLLEVLGEKRLEKMCPYKTLLKAGFKLPNGTDSPGYIPTDPLREIWACVVRRTMGGRVIAPEESVSVMDAIRIHTINAAYAEFEENIKGSIEPGKLADMVVLAEDPLTIPPDKIRNIKVDYTIVDGEVMYQRAR
jgi:predicted amidohydrolase YtcJ